MKSEKLKVIVCGAAGKMGRKTCETVMAQEDMTLVGCFDVNLTGRDIGELITGKPSGVKLTDNLDALLRAVKPDAAVDFTKGYAAPANIRKCLNAGVPVVVGTTGMADDEMKEFEELAVKKNTPLFIAPNFSIGAVLMMKFAREAAKYFEWGEIIELHHENKIDAPSGTALRTAELMSENREKFNAPEGEKEKVEGVRGGLYKGIRIHSVRLQGLLAHQKVQMGGLGETLTISHDSLSRDCFMPGVMLSLRNVRGLEGLVTGLENIM